MFGQLLLFTGCSSIQSFDLFFMTYRTPNRDRGPHSHLAFCDLRDTMPRQMLLLSTLATFVNYSTLCHTRGHHSHFPLKPYLEDFPRDGKYYKIVPLHTFLAYFQAF